MVYFYNLCKMVKVKLVETKSEIAAGTRGASLGVDALKTACLDKGSDYFAIYETVEVENVNDMLFEDFHYEHAKFVDGVMVMEERMCNAVYQTIQEGYFPIVLAGDHSTAAGTISGIKKAYPDKRIGVVWIDAHADLHSPYTTPSGNMHGMPLAMVCGIDNVENKINNPSSEVLEYWEKLKNVGVKGPKVDLKDIVFIAIRDTEEQEEVLIEQFNVKRIKTEEIKSKGIEKIVKEVMERLDRCDLVYISFDVDSLDSRISEGTGTPVPYGLSVQEAIDLNCQLISHKKVCAWEMVEVNPTLDSLNLMAENAFEILEATTNQLLKR